MKHEAVVGLVLAAGASMRMGPDINKLVALVDGKPLIAGPVDAMCEAGIDRVFVVTGYQAPDARAALADRNCSFISHPGWAAGMGASIAAGVRGLREAVEPTGVLISVGDLAGLRAEWLVALLEAFAAADSPKALCVPTFGGRFGHPVLFGAAYLRALAELDGDRGGRSILRANPEHISEVVIESDAIFRDLDTPGDLEAWRSRSKP